MCRSVLIMYTDLSVKYLLKLIKDHFVLDGCFLITYLNINLHLNKNGAASCNLRQETQDS